MANYWRNTVTFKGNQEQIEELFEFIKADDGRAIDFNQITPMPRWVYGSDPSITGISKEDKEKYGKGNTSLEWRIKNWGTKWNALYSERHENVLTFETANGASVYLTEKLAWLYPELEIEHVTYDSKDPFFGNIYTFTFKDTDYTEVTKPMLTEEELREELPELFEDE